MIVAATMGIMDQDLETMERMELGSLEEDTGSYNKREQKRRKKKKINSCGPTAFQVKRDIAAFSREKNVFTTFRVNFVLLAHNKNTRI